MNVAFHSSYVNCGRYAAVVLCTQNTVDWGEKLNDTIRAMLIVSYLLGEPLTILRGINPHLVTK